MRCLEHYKPSYINHGAILRYMKGEEITMNPTGGLIEIDVVKETMKKPIIAAYGSQGVVTIVYTNGKKWHQKHVSDWTVWKNKSGGFDIDYSYRDTYVLTDSSNKPAYTKDVVSMINHTSHSGDVAELITYSKNRATNTKGEIRYKFQPIKGDV